MIDGVFYINLDGRTDRRKEVEGELERMGLPLERFPGIKTTPGIVGCGMAHCGVLKEARRRRYTNVLVVEDDFMFLVDKETFWTELRAAIDEVPDYDVLMLGYNMKQSEPYSDRLVKVIEAQAGSAYLVSSKMYDPLISMWEFGNQKILEKMEHWLYANDQVWKRLQPSTKWYAFSPRMGKQRPSMGDTSYAPAWAEYDC